MKKLVIILLSVLIILPAFCQAEGSSAFMTIYGRAELNGESLPVGAKIQVIADGSQVGELVIVYGGYYRTNNQDQAKFSISKYLNNSIVFKYHSIADADSLPGDFQVNYLGKFEAGREIVLDLPFVTDLPVSVMPNYSTSSPVNNNEEEVAPEVLGVKISNPDNLSLYNDTIALEMDMVSDINLAMSKRLSGYILLQTENNGEAWYVNPTNQKKYYLQNGAIAYEALRDFGLGITNADLEKIPQGDDLKFATTTNHVFKNIVNRLKGRILLQVENHGEAWYVNPGDGKRYYMKDGEAAYQIMRFFSLGVTNESLRQIAVGDLLN